MPGVDLTDRVAIVTGGSQGIGRAIALALAQAGADIVVAARTAERVTGVCNEVQALGRRALGLPTDVNKADQVAHMARRTQEEFGRIDILVNNAGGTPGGARAPLLQVTQEGFDETISLNLKSTLLCSQAAVPVMIEQQKGAIINVSSVAGRDLELPRVGFAIYGAAKAGVNSLTRSMAAEWAPYVRVNAILPGIIDSGRVTASRTPERMAERLASVALRRMGTPDETARLALFLASDAASYITGACFDVDGGIASPHSAV